MRRREVSTPRPALRLRIAVALVGGTLAALTGCAAAGIPPTTTQATISASVTQPAPSVWSGPETESHSATEARGSTAAAESTMPGLSASCSAVISAQVAINELFTEALGHTADGATTTAAGTATMATAPATRTPTGAPGPITAARVSEVFQPVTQSVPASLAAPFDTLRTAATQIIGKSVDAVPAILGDKPVTDAMHSISDYIADCQPPATD